MQIFIFGGRLILTIFLRFIRIDLKIMDTEIQS